MSDPQTLVKQRRVFHIPGYDPIHPRRYRELYRTEGAAQSQISGYTLEVSANPSNETFSWVVQSQIEDASVAARIDVLVWSDIVRDSMAQSIPATYFQVLKTAWIYIATGTMRRLMWMRKGPVIAALYPVVMLMAQMLVAVLVGRYLGNLVQSGIVWLLAAVGLSEGVVYTVLDYIIWALKLAIWGTVLVLLLRWFKRIDNKLFAYYLMHDYAFTAQHWGANPPALQDRMTLFEDQIAKALTSSVDEVLIVGHSSGAHIAISVVAELLRSGRVPSAGPRLALLTLGQVVPMVSFLPQAKALRRDLAYLATHDAITWVDVSAPGDGCSFALCDPVAVTGVTPPGKRWPLVISAAFTQSLSKTRWSELRWRFFRLHFQYLCAFDAPKDYDYFQITAGPRLLADRYAERPASKSRIDVPVSKYTSFVP